MATKPPTRYRFQSNYSQILVKLKFYSPSPTGQWLDHQGLILSSRDLPNGSQKGIAVGTHDPWGNAMEIIIFVEKMGAEKKMNQEKMLPSILDCRANPIFEQSHVHWYPIAAIAGMPWAWFKYVVYTDGNGNQPFLVVSNPCFKETNSQTLIIPSPEALVWCIMFIY